MNESVLQMTTLNHVSQGHNLFRGWYKYALAEFLLSLTVRLDETA